MESDLCLYLLFNHFHTTDTMPMQFEFEKAYCKKVGKLLKSVKGDVYLMHY